MLLCLPQADNRTNAPDPDCLATGPGHRLNGLVDSRELESLVRAHEVGVRSVRDPIASRAARLPDAGSRDNHALADMMNYGVFVLGKGSAPPGAKPLTAKEVARERALALTITAPTKERARQVDAAIRKRHAPISLRLLYPPQAGRHLWCQNGHQGAPAPEGNVGLASRMEATRRQSVNLFRFLKGLT